MPKTVIHFENHISVRVSSEMKERIKSLSYKERRSLSEALRERIEKWLE